MQRGLPFPSTFAEHADHAAIAIQIIHLKSTRFPDPQARREHRPEQHPIVVARHGLQQPRHLRQRKYYRQALRILRPREERHCLRLSQRFPIEENQRRKVLAQARWSRALSDQVFHPHPHLGLTQFLRRLPVEGPKGANIRQIYLPRSRRSPREFQIPRHPFEDLVHRHSSRGTSR